MYDGQIDPPAFYRLQTIASEAAEYYFDYGAADALLGAFEKQFDKAITNPKRCKHFDEEARMFDFSYRGFNYYAVFIITGRKIYITDIFSKRQNVERRRK